MRNRTHTYEVSTEWTGNLGTGTADYRSYERSHRIMGGDKPAIEASSDPAFRGDPKRYNPEELLVGSLSSCHMLWYLHLCASEGLVVVEYRDAAVGIMEEDPSGGGRFQEVTLHPRVVIRPPFDSSLAEDLHDTAHEYCFIAASVNFPVRWVPETWPSSESTSGQNRLHAQRPSEPGAEEASS